MLYFFVLLFLYSINCFAMIVSIDVGMKNLAICVLDSEASKIQAWHLINLMYGTDLCSAVIQAMDPMLSTLSSDTTIVIERQMTRKMTNIQCYLEMYFRLKGYSVIIYSPKYKLAGTGKENSGKGKALYTARKKASIELCRQWLETHLQEDAILERWTKTKKKDDLSDTLAMAIAYLAHPRSDPTLVKEVRARKPTLKQQQKGVYSKANIKYLLQQSLKGGDLSPTLDKKVEKSILKFWPNLEACRAEFQI